MSYRLKIPTDLLAAIRGDLKRPHFFAHERVGFLTAGAVETGMGGIDLLAREYFPVSDQDYQVCQGVGAMIGADAMRKGLQSAYRDRSCLIHIHTHGGVGIPEFSKVDLDSGKTFVPSFFNLLPQVPHGLAVLSNNALRLLIWVDPEQSAQTVEEIIEVGSNYRKYRIVA